MQNVKEKCLDTLRFALHASNQSTMALRRFSPNESIDVDWSGKSEEERADIRQDLELYSEWADKSMDAYATFIELEEDLKAFIGDDGFGLWPKDIGDLLCALADSKPKFVKAEADKLLVHMLNPLQN